MTILYIDDDAEDREFFQEAAQSVDSSLQCYTAKDGYEGLAALDNMMVMPDFIFVDMNMPVMNGRQFLTEIKKRIRVRSIPVVIYTTTAHPGDQLMFEELGAFKVLVKPNSLGEITRLVKSVISTDKAGAEKQPILAPWSGRREKAAIRCQA